MNFNSPTDVLPTANPESAPIANQEVYFDRFAELQKNLRLMYVRHAETSG